MSTKPAQNFLLFLIGGSLFAAGVFLFTNQVMVSSGLVGFGWGGRGAGAGVGGGGGFLAGIWPLGLGGGAGLLMIPFGIGVALLFSDTLRRLGWFLVWAASGALGVGVLQSLLFSFRPTSLWSLLAMVVMIASGGGLLLQSLLRFGADDRTRREEEVREERQTLQELRDELEELKAKINRR
ncbi:MAG: hypothetical protein ACK522_14865 [Synechococcaceae cyanobacterium]